MPSDTASARRTTFKKPVAGDQVLDSEDKANINN